MRCKGIIVAIPWRMYGTGSDCIILNRQRMFWGEGRPVVVT